MSQLINVVNQIHRHEVAIASTEIYAKELPREATATADSLKRAVTRTRDLASAQERAKQQLIVATQQLRDAMHEGKRLNSRILRLAEATWGPRHPRLREFRPGTEGRTAKRASTRHKQPNTAQSTPVPVAISRP